jgi:hypothetical protein
MEGNSPEQAKPTMETVIAPAPSVDDSANTFFLSRHASPQFTSPDASFVPGMENMEWVQESEFGGGHVWSVWIRRSS